MRVASEAEFIELREGYRRGVPRVFGDTQIDAVNRVAQIVAQTLPARRAGMAGMKDNGDFPEGIFWRDMAISGDTAR